MDQRIVFPNDDGGVCVVIPAPDCGLSLEEIAAKDVPEGKPFKIVNLSDLPDREGRAEWSWSDFSLEES